MRVCTQADESRGAPDMRGERAPLNDDAVVFDGVYAPASTLPTAEQLAITHDSLCELLGIPETRWTTEVE